jgi:hypothetical protein
MELLTLSNHLTTGSGSGSIATLQKIAECVVRQPKTDLGTAIVMGVLNCVKRLKIAVRTCSFATYVRRLGKSLRN